MSKSHSVFNKHRFVDSAVQADRINNLNNKNIAAGQYFSRNQENNAEISQRRYYIPPQYHVNAPEQYHGYRSEKSSKNIKSSN